MLDFSDSTNVFYTRLKEGLPSHPSPQVSEKYSFIDTIEVAEKMMDLGFTIAGAQIPQFRTKSGRYRAHLVDFRPPVEYQDLLPKTPTGEVSRVLFVNSYDGSKKATLQAGVFRFACANGLIIGETDFKEEVLHKNLEEGDFLRVIDRAVEGAKKGVDHVQKLKDMILTPEEAREMAKRALKVRFGSSFSVKPETALIPRRAEDLNSDLWTVWNRLQENLMDGGLPGLDENGNMKRSRPISQLSRMLRMNQDLWDILIETGKKIEA